jgi:hypothetical protein
VMVVDASVVLALALPLPYSDLASARIRALKASGEELYAPPTTTITSPWRRRGAAPSSPQTSAWPAAQALGAHWVSGL